MTNHKRHLKVFLCHASDDKSNVRDIYLRLISDGIDVWLDEEKLLPGQRWRDEIPKVVHDSDVVIIFLSKQSVAKPGYFQKEIKYALDAASEKPERAIFLIPARLEECDVPRELDDWHRVDLFSDDGYQKLIASLNSRAKDIDVSAVKIKDKTRPTGNTTPTSIQNKPKTEKPRIEPEKLAVQDRVLEAAIEKEVIVGKPTQLFVQIRRLGSKGILSVIKSIDDEVKLDTDNVKSKSLQIEFPIYNDQISSAEITLKIVAHQFDPQMQQINISIPPYGDSEVCTFTITPKIAGNLLLSLEVLKNQTHLVTRTLRTTALDGEKENNSLVLISIPIIVFVQMLPQNTISELTQVNADKPKIIIPKPRPKKYSKAVNQAIILALIGLIGTIFTALFTSPAFNTWLQTLRKYDSTPVLPTATPIPYARIQSLDVIMKDGNVIGNVNPDGIIVLTAGWNVTDKVNIITNLDLKNLIVVWEFCHPENNVTGQGAIEIPYILSKGGQDCITIKIKQGEKFLDTAHFFVIIQ